ncbi:hypothetical protein K450DRAFT_216999 [Umbelopsis ramanniana AG]|uniref:DNA mismatch repair protein n=1 Tax=Umbelopsis ramanniana AG TaxID=1314678 RepID=A0AAD5HHE5_UMBRA|nr:uncharacterized protein K450DRAFT_216999 [Umbelopsis ramanniana AG]KAI8584582.1 hypothetical protein K450DRAFT_216999 [Umbelopsis ramanniana AG]
MGIASKENEPRAKANQKPPQTVMAQRSLLSFFKPPTATNVPKAQEASSKPEQPKRVAAEESDIAQKIPESPSKKRPTHMEHRPKPSRASPTPGALESMDIDTTGGNSDEELFDSAKRSARSKRRLQYFESDSEDEEKVAKVSTSNVDKGQPKKRKLVRRKVVSDSDDYEDEGADDIEEEDDDIVADMSEDDAPVQAKPSPVKAKPAASLTPVQQRFSNISMTSPLKKPSAFSPSSPSKAKKEDKDQRYAWLLHPKDADGNPEGSENYDSRTLLVPKNAWDRFTPFEKQYWEIKSKHWDTIVFFKKGKFYELYEKDADIGHQEFDLKLTDRVNMRMVGVPEMSFDMWAAQFVARGHKVAKVDQMETAIGKTMRERETKSKADKIIKRGLSYVLTAGTLVDSGLLTSDMSIYCMSIKELCSTENAAPSFGICFVDTSTAHFNLAVFEDDVNRTKLETLLMQVQPREVITERGQLSQKTTRLLKNTLSNPIWNQLMPEREFWDERVTEDEIRIAKYYERDGKDEWPQVLVEAKEHPILMSALGGLIWYLRSLKLDKELLSLKNITHYDPIKNTTSLVLDGQTLANLEILQNSYDGSDEGTVIKLLNQCVTPFGKRLFKRWLCHPLRSTGDIVERQDAVEELMAYVDVQEMIATNFRALPDLERLISRIHAGNCKVKEFLVVLEAFKSLQKSIDSLESYASDFNSNRLKNLISQFPKLNDQITYFGEAFQTGEVMVDYQRITTIIPQPGIEEDWDEVQATLSDYERQFQEHIQDMRKQHKCSKLVYKDLGKEIYQIEAPKEFRAPKEWARLSATGKLSRYWTPTIRKLVGEYKEALETKNSIVKSFTSRVYAKFDEHYFTWLSAVKHAAELDCLLSLAISSMSLGEPVCRPEFVDSEKSVLELHDLRHPCIAAGVATDFIPNDTYLGGERPNIIVLTGPNMGGKSTLLRQTCVAIIMAQLGCYVPASRCRMTPFDRIYTRIGANDNILAGQSTFMVELSETSKILHEATPHSMVILDELGRGTSTFDGYAIAYAVLHYLATHVGCLGLFSTHYQTLCQEFERVPEVVNMHMAYHIDENEHDITFLYKLTEGACQKSFGMNVANMAGIPKSIVEQADSAATQFEQTHRLKDTTLLMDVDSSGPVATPSMLSDFEYLMKVGKSSADDDVGDKADDTRNTAGRHHRQLQILKRIAKAYAH